MTTLVRYQGMDLIAARLEKVRWRHLLFQAARAISGLTAAVAGGCALAAAAAGYWPDQPPTLLRWSLLALLLGGWAGMLVYLVAIPLRRRMNQAQAARFIEQGVPGMDNILINALQLSRDAQQDPDLVQRAISETLVRTAQAPLNDSVRFSRLRYWYLAAAGAAAALTLLAIFQGLHLSRGLAAVFAPRSYVRQIGSLQLRSLKPGDATLFAGDSLEVTAEIDNPDAARYEARLEIPGKPPQIMIPSLDRASYGRSIENVQESFQYAVRIGDSKFPADRPYYTVRVLRQIAVAGIDLALEYPHYLGKPAETLAGVAGPIEAPLGTGVEVTLRLAEAAPAAFLETRNGPRGGTRMNLTDTGRTGTASFRITGDDGYRMTLYGDSGKVIQRIPDPQGAVSADIVDGYFRVRAIPDDPPKIAFAEPAGEAAVAPGGKLAALLRASDDHGLASVHVFVFTEGKDPPSRPTRDLTAAAGKTAVELPVPIAVPADCAPGTVMVYFASGTDGRQIPDVGGPQTTTTPRFRILVQDASSVAKQANQRFEQLRDRLMAILAAQEHQRVTGEIAARRLADIQEVRAAGKEIAAGQTAIKNDVFDLVDRFPFQPEMLTIREALALLGKNEAVIAVTQARVLENLDAMAGRDQAARALTDSQDKILRALQTMLGILPSLANPATTRPTRGEDLPPEVKDQLKTLSEDLKKFMDDQRKVIDASQRLAKRPVDTLTPEQDKLLRDLQTTQDKWEKFLNEKIADFSKMAQQDFSNPTMLQELISVKTDVTMAKDALSKKASEIATAIEDNGIENAKSLTTNIEKWLPDEPDRIKWDMEDPAGQSSTEQPEMPKELEDLVGDLLEQEEDLFDEMEDATAKYNQSGDKGIGWDAMDGPISNMNAQGVTGNQLPNSMEISGRSGEGRQGKATGEFVEDKAVGKGGRRTPTRLTPEPFQQGQIKDTSKEPPGGSTGGGKLSGAGEEGLEGPLPPPLKQELQRLAGKQAQLLNRAERVAPTLKPTDFSNYQFLQTVTLLRSVQNDLDNFRYSNALRQRQVVVDSLKKSQLLLGGKVDVTVDTSDTLPKHVKDDIYDARTAKLPPEFSDVLENYFRRLAEEK